MENKIFISGNVPSKKNSKNVVRLKNGKTLVRNSKAVDTYIKEHLHEWENNKDKFLNMIKDVEPPYKIIFTFIRATRHKFDYNNISQLPCDLMVKCGWVSDDNADIIIPIFRPYGYDKKNSGVYIEVEKGK